MIHMHPNPQIEMIGLRKLIALTRMWQRVAGIKRRAIAISLPRILRHKHKVADKGYFVVYSIDKARFVIPLSYLRTNIFKELFRLSEEEFGLPTDGPITFPCDAPFLEYLLSLLHNDVSFELIHKALLLRLASSHPLAHSPITISGAS